MLIPTKEYTEQFFVNHDDPVNRYFEIDTLDNVKNIIVKDSFRYEESASSSGKVRFGLCSIPYFECQIKRPQNTPINKQKRIILTAKTHNIAQNLDGDVIRMGTFVLTKYEATNIPYIYSIRAELDVNIKSGLSDNMRHLLMTRKSYDPRYVMGLYALLKLCIGEIGQEKVTEKNDFIARDVDFIASLPVKYELYDNVTWYVRCDLYAEATSQTGGRFNAYFYDRNAVYKCSADPGDDFGLVRSIMSGEGIFSNWKNLTYNPLIVEADVNNKLASVVLPMLQDEYIFMGGESAAVNDWMIAFPKRLVLKNGYGQELLSYEISKNFQIYFYENDNYLLNGVDGYVSKRTEDAGVKIFKSDELNDLDLRSAANDALEIQGLCTMFKRRMSLNEKQELKIFTLPEPGDYYFEQIYPQGEVYPSDFIFPNFVQDKNVISFIGDNTLQRKKYDMQYVQYSCVKYQYKDNNDNEQIGILYDELFEGDKGFVYDLTKNKYFVNDAWDAQAVTTQLNEGILRELHRLEFLPMNIDSFGNPLIELWDRIEIYDKYANYEKPLRGFVVSRTISGGQFMRDSIECKTEALEVIDLYDEPIEAPDEEIPNYGGGY